MLRELPIVLIDPRADARAVDPAAVEALAESIAAVGLINPIRVRASGERWEVIAGRHRLAACQALGLVDINAVVVTDDDLHAELAMIDENLCRVDLTPSERARQTARRKAIYLSIHPQTAEKVAGALGSNIARGRATDSLPVASFAADTAAKSGRDERTIRRDAERGTKVIDEVLDLINGTPLDTGAFLDSIKDLSPNDQFKAATRELGIIRQRERSQRSSANAAKLQADVKARAAREVAGMIAEHIPGEWWDAVKSNLYAAGAKNIGDALTNITGEAIMDRSAA